MHCIIMYMYYMYYLPLPLVSLPLPQGVRVDQNTDNSCKEDALARPDKNGDTQPLRPCI